MSTEPAPRQSRFSDDWLQNFDTICDNESPTLESTTLPIATDIKPLLRFLCTNSFNHNDDKLQVVTRLSELALQTKTTRDEIRNAGGVAIIIRFLAVNKDIACIQMPVCKVLTALTEDGEAQAVLAQCEVVEAIIDIIKTHHADEVLVRTALVAISALSQHAENRKYLQVTPIVSVLLDVLNSVTKQPKCMTVVCAILSSAVFQADECRKFAGEAGAVDVVVKGMKEHAIVPELCSSAAIFLQNLLCQNECNVAKFLEADGMDIVFHLLEEHPDDKIVIRNVLGMLKNVLTSMKARKELIDNKIWMMQMLNTGIAYSTQLDISKYVIGIWTCVAETDNDGERLGIQAIVDAVIEADVTTPLPNCLVQAHEERNLVTFLAMCRLKMLLTLSDTFRQPKIKAIITMFTKDTELLVKALTTFVEEEEAMLPLLKILGTILSGHDDIKMRFNDIDGVTTIVTVMKKHRLSEEINENCCRVLDIAAEGQVTAQTLMKGREAARAAIMTCMADFAESAKVQEYACSLLIKVAMISTKDAAELVQAGARNMVQIAQLKHARNPAVESLANQLLVLLVDQGSEGRLGQPSRPRGTAGARMRSRSRTIEDSGTVRARANKSKSPVRVGKGRLARPTREVRGIPSKDGGRSGVGDAGSGGDGQDRGTPSRVRVRRAARQQMMLEPVYE